MINTASFYKSLLDCGVDFFAGVPDSLLKEFCAYLNDNCLAGQHVICANEGNAIAMAAGSYLATGKVPLVYMQNSGLGNATNPLLSLADNAVYGIPFDCLGCCEPGLKDEPQHVKQGLVQNALLEAMNIPYEVLDSETLNWEGVVRGGVERAQSTSSPVAIVVRKGSFTEYKAINKSTNTFTMSREEAIRIILETDNSYAIVSTTGKTSRELYELRELRHEQSQDFLTVGSMGHSSSIAAGIAMRCPETRIMCIDGDGALIMHMGSMAVIGKLAPKNFLHVIMNNQCHESVGGQATSADKLDMEKLPKRRILYSSCQIGNIPKHKHYRTLSGPFCSKCESKSSEQI
jgi:phosphonopyruvate decarboxylase